MQFQRHEVLGSWQKDPRPGELGRTRSFPQPLPRVRVDKHKVNRWSSPRARFQLDKCFGFMEEAKIEFTQQLKPFRSLFFRNEKV